jgi:hypothetical protein
MADSILLLQTGDGLVLVNYDFLILQAAGASFNATYYRRYLNDV